MKGSDDRGNKYSSVEDMWQKELNPESVEEEQKINSEADRIGSKESWY